jgi:hypothetical protein
LDATVGWTTLKLDSDSPLPAPPLGYTPCDIREIDVIIQTADTGDYMEAVLHIDTIAVAAKTAGDAGVDATGSGD